MFGIDSQRSCSKPSKCIVYTNFNNMASSSNSPTKKSSSDQQHLYIILEQQEPDDATNNCDKDVSLDSSDNSLGPSDGLDPTKIRPRFSELTWKIFSALFYATCSFLIMVINKILLTSYGFPSSNLLGIGQMVAIIVILKLADALQIVTIKKVSLTNRKIWILAAFYLGNLVSGLGGTKHLPLPIFTALRRFSLAMTAYGEYYVLRVKQSMGIIMTIAIMILGSLVAAASDLTFNLKGYSLVMVNNFFTSANVVYIKKTIDSKEINKYAILYYNALLTIVPLTVVTCFTTSRDDLINFAHWTEAGFIISFLLSCCMGFLLMFSTVLCTQHNSALTTSIVGTMKNILTTYVGMYIGGDYKYSIMNFIGLNISLAGSMIYSYMTFNPNNCNLKSATRTQVVSKI